jgi:hypothetical protein
MKQEVIQQMKKERSLHSELKDEYKGRVTIWRIKENDSVIFLDQGDNFTKGWVIGEINTDGKVSSSVNEDVFCRRLTQVEYQSIVNFFQHEAEPHDLSNFNNDEYAVLPEMEDEEE